MNRVEEIEPQTLPWFYEVNGVRKGGVSESEMIELITKGTSAGPS